jgi:hypothetical protein
MDKPELLGVMREALAAITELTEVLARHSPVANAQVIEAREHFEHAIALLELEGVDRPTRMRLAE